MKKAEVGYVFMPDGTQKTVYPVNKKRFNLTELQKYVGGYIQEIVYPMPEWRRVYVNEEGRRMQLEPNIQTEKLLNMNVYGVLNGYPPGYKALGNIFGIKIEERKNGKTD